MCGITERYHQADGQRLAGIMTDRIAHRGPDATGTWSHQDDRVGVHPGHRRLTGSDTEAVLEAWPAWAPGGLRRFRGMFSFTSADEATGDLVLARDPLSIKPLYYLPRGGSLVFASELKLSQPRGRG